MGGSNRLSDDSTVNGECHVIKWIHTAAVYYAGFKMLTCLRDGRVFGGAIKGLGMCLFQCPQ